MLAIIPSRGRPAQLRRLITALIDTETTCRINVRLDEDDPQLSAYWASMPGAERLPGFEVTVGKPSHGASRAVQEVFSANPDEAAYLSMPDDTIPRTKHWDRLLSEAAGRLHIAYPDDGINGPKFAAYAVIGGQLVRAFGWLQLPGISHLYADAVWNHVGDVYHCKRYLGGVVLEHDKVTTDATHRAAVSTREKDRITFENWKSRYQPDGVLAKVIATND